MMGGDFNLPAGNMKKALNLLFCAVIAVAVTGLIPSAFAQEQPAVVPVQAVQATDSSTSEPLRIAAKKLKDFDLPGLQQKVSMKAVTSWDVAQVIDFLAHEGKLNNIVIGKSVTGSAKFQFEGATVGDALDVVLAVNNLAYEIKGGIIKIIPDAEYQTLYGTSFYDNKQVKIVSLKNASVARLTPMIDKIKSTIGVAVVDPVSNTLVLIDTPDKLKEMMAIIDKADILTTTETKTFVLQYASVEDVQKELVNLVTKEVGTVRFDKRTKTLIVTDLSTNMPKVELLVKTFDKRSRQVFIEAKVVEITLSDTFSFGVNWQNIFNGLDPRFSLKSVSLPGSPATPIGRLTFNTIVSGGDLQVILDALKQVAETKILSSPNVAVVDGQEASIKVIENQPYKEVKIESGTTNITGVSYVFVEVGVALSVTPKINDENIITCLVKPEISSISQWYDGSAQEGTPVVKKAVAETTVTVKDGVTIIIGGMIKDRKDTTENSVPLLGRIPLLGRLFRYDSSTTVNTETVVFLTPRIVTGDESYLRSRDMKKALKPLRPVNPAGEKALKPVR